MQRIEVSIKSDKKSIKDFLEELHSIIECNQFNLDKDFILIKSSKVENDREVLSDMLVRKIYMECPLCDKEHEVEERRRSATLMVKGLEVEYEETYYYCSNGNKYENEFETGKISSANLLNARNSYRRKMGYLTSNEIVEIREKYGLSQVELAKLLGWGEATISRYESKAIQDEAYDNMLRMIRENPLIALEYLEKNI